MGRIRVGVIGCGLIGQIMHLPHLKELHELFELRALCDVSPGTLKYVGDYYGVSKRFSDHRELLKEPVDAVVVLSADSHGQVIVDSLKAGKHVFTEKPMCFTLREADEILAAHKKAGTLCMVTYMKRYDPGFRYAQPLVQQMRDLQAIHITVLHPSEGNQIGHHDVRRVMDVPADVRAKLQADQDALIREVIGDFTPLERRVFANNLLSTLVHDINVLRGLSGDPGGGAVHGRLARWGGDGHVPAIRFRASAPSSACNTSRTWRITRRRWRTMERATECAWFSRPPSSATCPRRSSSRGWRTGNPSRRR